MPMKKLEKSDLIPAGADMMAGIDLYGNSSSYSSFPYPLRDAFSCCASEVPVH